VEFRYPGHDALAVTDSVGPIPQGWRLGTLGELVAVNAETIKRPDPSELIRYVDIASVSTGTVQPPKPVALSDAPGRARRRVRDGDVIWSTVRPNLRSYALMLDPGRDVVASTGFAVLSPRHASFAYVYSLATTDLFVEYLSRRASGAAYPAVTPPIFATAPALIPAAHVLRAFAELTEPLWRLASKLRLQSTNLAGARDVVLLRLISGEIDVTNLAIAMPPTAA
jgi:type I restriction enzyme S subunit